MFTSNVRAALIRVIFLSLLAAPFAGCVEMMQRQEFEDDIGHKVNEALSRQQEVLIGLQRELLPGGADRSVSVEMTTERFNEAVKLADLRFATLAKSYGMTPEILSYNKDSNLFATLAASLDSKWFSEALENPKKLDAVTPNHLDEVTIDLSNVRIRSSVSPERSISPLELLAQSPAVAKYERETKANLERLKELYPALASIRIKAEEESNAAFQAKYKADRDAALAANQGHKDLVRQLGLDERVGECQYGPLFSEMRAGVAAHSVLKQWGADDSKLLTAEQQQQTVAMIDALSKATCDCTIAKISQQPEPLQRRFYSIVKGEKQRDLYGNPMGEQIGMQFMALATDCSKEGALVISPEKVKAP